MRILIVYPNIAVRRILSVYLEQAGYEVRAVHTVEEATAALRESPVGLLICRWPLQGNVGLELLQSLRANGAAGRYVYVLLIAPRSYGDELIAGLSVGADDYLLAPINLKQLRRRVILGARIQRLKVDLAQANQALDMTRTHDRVTGLLNREALSMRLNDILAGNAREEQALSLILLDLVNLAEINVQHGYKIGDQILRQVAEVVAHGIRQRDLVGRWTGTTLVLVLPESNRAAADKIAQRLRIRLDREPYRAADGRSIAVSVQLGIISIDPSVQTTVAVLVTQIDGVVRQAWRTHSVAGELEA